MIDEVTLGGLPLIGPTDAGVQYGLYQLDGWGSPAARLSSQPRSRQHGSWVGDAFLAARSVALVGEARLPSAVAAVAAEDALIAAASLSSTVLEVTEGDVVRSVRVQRDGDVLVSWVPRMGLSFDWSIQLLAPDPRRFAATLTTTIALPSTSGGLTWPVTWPVTWTAVTQTGQGSLTNPGNTVGPVRLRLDGPTDPGDPPLTGPVVTHVSSGKRLVFASSLTLAHGEFVTVDMERREVLAQGIEPRNGWVTRREWSAFVPGDNTWSFAAQGASASSLLTVEADPAWQ